MHYEDREIKQLQNSWNNNNISYGKKLKTVTLALVSVQTAHWSFF